MSQQELEQTDQEVIAMVNRSATPEAKRRADQIEKNVKDPSQEGCAAEEAERFYKECCRKRKIRTALCVVACLLISVALLVVLFAPALLVWVVNIGVLCCGIVAGIAIDRQCRHKL